MTELAALAAAEGVATEYVDWEGNPVVVAESTLRAVLDALGPGSGREGAVPPFVMARAGRATEVPVRADPSLVGSVRIELEGGGFREAEVRDGVATIPGDLPPGWHTLRAGDAVAPLAVAPARLGLPPGREWGFMAQLYSIRSDRSWGFGDLGDLRELATWSGRDLGAGFVLVNPLHSGPVVPPLENSPYLPSSRRYAEPLYLRVEDVEEYAALPPEALRAAEKHAGPLRETNGSGELIDREAVWAVKRPVLEAVFRMPRGPEREAAFRAYVGSEGEPLRNYATWVALAAEHGHDWHAWPEDLRHPGSTAVAEAQTRLAAEIEFVQWLQWLLDEQLRRAHEAAKAAGMPIGIVHDLAVGVSPHGADSWALQDVLALGVTVGAPPDAFNQQGQNWAQPPWSPRALAEAGYAPYRDLIRTLLRHAGGIRVDHVLGLFRLWWVPEGQDPLAGTYVRYDAEALVGILALEAYRAGAVVIGEDLGTVAPGVRETLADFGILGSSVLWFEVDDEGDPLPPDEWRELSLASLTTHDLPTTAAALTGEHVNLRAELGLLTRPVAEEREVDAANRRRIADQLAEYGLRPGSEQEAIEAMHRYLTLTPARLIGVSLPDAVGDRRPQNLPGTSTEYPNWCVPLTDGDGEPVLLGDLSAHPQVKALVKTLTDGLRRPR
ncbi:MAG: 4-alpha-glucanotransferase [Cryptosporangiaceae bacterium]|nr:4-alpha-glucanotransferase [Cryptosporangiaceae bacterium]